MSAQTDIYASLRDKLSPDANIHVEGSETFSSATLRWTQYKVPRVKTVVEVATENDVVETVKYANANNIPFIAYSGGHGPVTGLENSPNAIQISMGKLDSVEISETGTTATFGGGILAKKVTDTLWKAGKQTVTGCCVTTSLLGAGLGGGYGFLQGKYGLISDQFVSARIVLADGTVQDVSSQSGDPDLWWALQGAGHNFGIVTSITMKVHDVGDNGIWSYASFAYGQDKVERLYELINTLWPDGSLPSGIIHFSFLMCNPAIDAEKPIISFNIIKNSSQPIESIYTQPFLDLEPISSHSGSGTYPDVPGWIGLDERSSISTNQDLHKIMFPVNLQNYSPEAQRKVYDVFAKETSEALGFRNSFIVFESYTYQGVKAVPSESSAFPHRDDKIVICPIVIYDNKDNNPDIDAKARTFGETMRQILFAASGEKQLHAYVNYASTSETLEDVYGSEPWRLQKLRDLKKKYDPEGRFNHYYSVL